MVRIFLIIHYFQAGLNPLWNPSLSSLYYNSDHLLQLQHRIGLGLGNDATALQQLLFQSFQQQQLQQQAKGERSFSMFKIFQSLIGSQFNYSNLIG